MPEDLINQHRLAKVLGAARVLRFVRAGWLKAVQRSPRVLYRIADVHACLRRLERGEVCPPDRVESARTNDSHARHGRAYVPKGRKPRPSVEDIILDFSAVNL
jgi:hypothetical protein